MKKVPLHRNTIRFRKWSRKAYAVFASLGRCVTIGCLPKGVADSSLSKQKAGATVGCKNNGHSIEEINDGKSQETDIGVPLGGKNGLVTSIEIFGFKELHPVLCPVNAGRQGGKYTDIIINENRTQMARTIQSGNSNWYRPRHLRFSMPMEFYKTKEYDSRRTEKQGAARCTRHTGRSRMAGRPA